jgi:hypothetical protein
MKDFKLMKKITEEGDLRSPDQFYKLRGVFDKEGKNRKGRDDFRNEEEIYQSR